MSAISWQAASDWFIVPEPGLVLVRKVMDNKTREISRDWTMFGG